MILQRYQYTEISTRKKRKPRAFRKSLSAFLVVTEKVLSLTLSNTDGWTDGQMDGRTLPSEEQADDAHRKWFRSDGTQYDGYHSINNTGDVAAFKHIEICPLARPREMQTTALQRALCSHLGSLRQGDCRE